MIPGNIGLTLSAFTSQTLCGCVYLLYSPYVSVVTVVTVYLPNISILHLFWQTSLPSTDVLHLHTSEFVFAHFRHIVFGQVRYFVFASLSLVYLCPHLWSQVPVYCREAGSKPREELLIDRRS